MFWCQKSPVWKVLHAILWKISRCEAGPSIWLRVLQDTSGCWQLDLLAWGCGYSQVQHKVNVVITTSTNRILNPPNQLLSSTHGGEGKWQHIIGYNSWSPELVLSVFSHPHWISYLQQLPVWYGEDLMDWGEGDNGGRVCCDVFALYV